MSALDLTPILETKKNELEQIQRDIDTIEKSVVSLKPAVKEYNEKKKKSSELKKIKKEKETNLQIFGNFIAEIDEHYLDEYFPLFKGIETNPAKPIEEEEYNYNEMQ